MLTTTMRSKAMSNRFVLADGLDVLSCVLLTYITTTDVLDWIYISLLIVSLVLGVVLKIRAAIKDGKITKEEEAEIKKEIDEAGKKIKDEIENKEAKEDGIHNRDD